MRRTSVWAGAGLGLLTSLPVLSLLWLGERVAGLPYVPFDLFEWLTRVLPGPVVTFGIDAMVTVISGLGIGPLSAVAKAAEMALAVALMVFGGAVFGFVLGAIGKHDADHLVLWGLAGGALLGSFTVYAVASLGFPAAGPVGSTVWLVAVLLGWGAVLGAAIRRVAAPPFAGEAYRESRRRFLAALVGASLAVFGLAVGLGRLLAGRRPQPGRLAEETRTTEGTSGPAASPPRETLAERFEPVKGTRRELTENDAFYRIDINLRPPEIDERGWRLRVDGLVDRPLELSLAEIRARPAVRQAITLECISNRLAGDLISTTVVTGVPLKAILEEARLGPEARAVSIQSADGFFESVGWDDLQDERTLLVYEMNGVPLPAEHGFPLRIYIPNRFGMKQPKWISRLEATREVTPGYWVVRGWSAEAVPPTTSVVDAVGTSMMLGEARVVPVGGIAYAGARGIGRIEVQVDDGPWTEARLRAPPLGPLTWVQWRYDWPYSTGRHTFRVRAWDGTGTLQPTAMTGPRPDGATGIHELTTMV